MCTHSCSVCTHTAVDLGIRVVRSLVVVCLLYWRPDESDAAHKAPTQVPFWWLDYHFSVQKVLRGYLGTLDCKRLIQLYKNYSQIKKRCSSGHNLVEGRNFIQVFHEAIFFLNTSARLHSMHFPAGPREAKFDSKFSTTIMKFRYTEFCQVESYY